MFINRIRHMRYRGSERGQLIVMAAVAMVAIIAMTGLVIDGSHAWSQRRGVQNAADMASLAGARVVGIVQTEPAFLPGADADVQEAIEEVLDLNGMSPTPCGMLVTENCYTAQYVDDNSDPILGSFVGGGFPPTAAGVRVEPTTQMDTFFMQIVGFQELTASAPATSRAGPAGEIGGPGSGLLPVGVVLNEDLWNDHFCPSELDASECTVLHMDTELEPGTGHQGLPGNFGWLSWDGSNNTADLRNWIGPPGESPTYTVPEDDTIGIEGMPGNKQAAASNIRDWAALETTVIIPIVSPGPPEDGENCTTQPDHCWPGTEIPYPESGGGTGSNANYNIVGFAGFELTGCGTNGSDKSCIENLFGVFRQVLFNGPTGSMAGTPDTPWHLTSIQLVK